MSREGEIDELRARAERRLEREPLPDAPKQSLTTLIRELQVHQVELSLQWEELQRTQGELAQSRSEYQALYDEAPVGYMQCTPQGIIQRANPAMASMLGTTVGRLVDTAFPRFATEAHKDTFHLHATALQDNVSASCEMMIERSDGERRAVRLHSTARQNGSTGALGLFICVIDETEIKRAQQRVLEERSRREAELSRLNGLEALGVLAAGVAHDFNNLLTVLSCTITLARTDPTRAEHALEEAEDALKMASALTNRLLTLGKGGSPIKEPISLGELLVRSTELFLRGSNARHELVIPDDLWAVPADEGQLAQVVQNLIVNADEAMPDGGLIRVRANNITLSEGEHKALAAGDYVHLSVEDEGIGIPEEQLTSIFSPYVTTKREGSGLGLAIIRSVVDKHDGHVRAVSRVGHGTTMHVYLPALPGVACPPSRPKQGAAPMLNVNDDPPHS